MVTIGTRARARTRRGLVTAGLSCLLLTGCQQNPPGVAATLGDEQITDTEVDSLAEVVCEAGAAQGGTVIATKAARTQALNLLIGLRLAEQSTDVSSVPPARIAEATQGSEVLGDTLSPEARETFDEFIGDSAAAQLATIELGRESLEAAGRTGNELNDADSQVEGQRLVRELSALRDVEVDPRFGSWVVAEDAEGGASGQLVTAGNGSLSVPVSDFATAADAGAEEAADAPGVLAELPASQKCGGPAAPQ